MIMKERLSAYGIRERTWYGFTPADFTGLWGCGPNSFLWCGLSNFKLVCIAVTASGMASSNRITAGDKKSWPFMKNENLLHPWETHNPTHKAGIACYTQLVHCHLSNYFNAYCLFCIEIASTGRAIGLWFPLAASGSCLSYYLWCLLYY